MVLYACEAVSEYSIDVNKLQRKEWVYANEFNRNHYQFLDTKSKVNAMLIKLIEENELGISNIPWLNCPPVWNNKSSWDWYRKIPLGWRIAFGQQFVTDLDNFLVANDLHETFHLTEVRKKYGTLRIHWKIVNVDIPQEIKEKIYSIIDIFY